MKTIETIYNNIIASDIFRWDAQEIDLCAALKELCAEIDAENDVNWYIGEFNEASLQDIIVGAYWAFADCHEGQYSETYETLCALGEIYTPGIESAPTKDCGEYEAYEMISEYLLK